MIDALIWAGAFVLMVLGMGGSAIYCVHTVERGKTERLQELEKTKRQGMDNAWQLEHAKLQMPQLASGAEATEVVFDVPGGGQKWT